MFLSFSGLEGWVWELPLPTLPSLESEFHGAMKLLLAQLDPDVSAEEGHLSDIVPGISVTRLQRARVQLHIITLYYR